MADDDRLIRELYAESASRPLPGHPDEATWEAWAVGELTAVRRGELADHVARCAECAAVYRGLKMLAAEAAAFDPAVPRPSRARVLAWPRMWLYGGLVAAAAAVLVVAIVPPSHMGPPSPAPPTVSDPLRSGEKSAPIPLEPLGRLTGPPRAFRWQPVAGAGRYRVELSSREGDLLWSSPEVTGTAVDWPAAVAASPGLYHWQVFVLPDAERPLASSAASAVVSFEVVGRP
jgi:hypothetical protein